MKLLKRWLKPDPSLLSYHELMELQREGAINHSLREHVNQTSIDITLSSKILIEQDGYGVVSLKHREPLKMSPYVMGPEGFLLMPGAFILASSEQVFHLPDDLSAEYKLKSSMARIGMEHMNAGWCDPGWHGSALTLEFKNMTHNHAIRLMPGDRCGQIVFFRCAPVPKHASYAKVGRYNGDLEVRGVKR